LEGKRFATSFPFFTFGYAEHSLFSSYNLTLREIWKKKKYAQNGFSKKQGLK